MADNRKRPGTIMFVAVVMFIFGTLDLVNVLGMGGVAIFIAASPDPDPQVKVKFDDHVAAQRFIAHEVPYFFATTMAFSFLDFLFGLALISYGRGVLKLMPTARSGTIVLIIVRLVYSIGFDIYTAILVLPAQRHFYELHPLEVPNQPPFDLAPIMYYVGLGALTFKIAMHLFVTTLMVSLLCTARTKEAFAGTMESLPSAEERKPASPYAGYEDDGAGAAPDTGIAN